MPHYSHFGSQIVPEDATEATGYFLMDAGKMAYTGTGANFRVADIVAGVSLPTNGTATWHGFLPFDLDVTAAITFNTYIFLQDAAAASDVVALAFAYQKTITPTTDGSDGTAAVAPATTTGLSATSDSITVDHATNFDDKFHVLTTTLAASTLAATDLVLPFGWGLTATLTGIAVDEWSILGTVVQYTRRFV